MTFVIHFFNFQGCLSFRTYLAILPSRLQQLLIRESRSLWYLITASHLWHGSPVNECIDITEYFCVYFDEDQLLLKLKSKLCKHDGWNQQPSYQVTSGSGAHHHCKLFASDPEAHQWSFSAKINRKNSEYRPPDSLSNRGKPKSRSFFPRRDSTSRL